MVVQRLVPALALYVGLGLVCAEAADVSEPLAVAVPVTAASSSPNGPEPSAGEGERRETGEQDAAAERDAAVPKDVPVPAGQPPSDPDPASGDASSAETGADTGNSENADNHGGPEGAGDSIEQETFQEHSDAASLHEEFVPYDLPPSEDEAALSGTDSGDGPPPAMEAVLGADPPLGGAYLVRAEILGIPNAEGMVSASLCTEKTFTKSGCRTLRVPAQEGQVSVTFDGVGPGVYAVQVHHDQNANGKMDFTFLGLPKEPYGFSRDAKPMLAPPKFRKASFEITDHDVTLVINLQNT